MKALNWFNIMVWSPRPRKYNSAWVFQSSEPPLVTWNSLILPTKKIKLWFFLPLGPRQISKTGIFHSLSHETRTSRVMGTLWNGIKWQVTGVMRVVWIALSYMQPSEYRCAIIVYFQNIVKISLSPKFWKYYTISIMRYALRIAFNELLKLRSLDS